MKTTPNLKFKAFVWRVRMVRAWLGFALGSCVGAFLALIWAVLDWQGVLFTEWFWLGLCVGVCALLGLVIGLFLRVPERALAQSIDRRGGLEDRLSTASERSSEEEAFDAPLRQDALARFEKLKPRELYPLRLSRWHGFAGLVAVLAASLFLLGNAPIALSPEKKAEKEELKRAALEVERVARPLQDKSLQAKHGADAERLRREIERFQRELEKGRLDKQTAMQKAGELAQKADELTKDRFKTAEQSLEKAQTTLDKWQKMQLEKMGVKGLSEQEMKALRETSMGQIDQQISSMKEQLSDLQKQLQNAKAQGDQAKAAELEKQIQEAQKKLQQLELSKFAKEALEKLMSDPEFKKLQEQMQKLQKQMQQAAESGQTELTKEELQEMQAQLEELAQILQDDELRKQFIEELKKSMEQAGGG